MDEKVIENLIEGIKINSKLCANIISIYIYGSVLREDYKPFQSDIDILIIVKNETLPVWFEELKLACSELLPEIDLNILFEYEVKMRIHPGWSTHYYFNVRNSGRKIFGIDILSELDSIEPSYEEARQRLVQLTQRSRFILLNEKKSGETGFWLKKYQQWIPLCMMEFLTLYGIPEYRLKLAHDIFTKSFELNFFIPNYPYESFKELNSFLENLSQWTSVNKHLFISSENN